MTLAQRFAFGLRAFAGTLVAAIVLATLWYFVFDIETPGVVSKFAFWSLLEAGFIAIMTFCFARIARWHSSVRFAGALALGAGCGFVFTIFAGAPTGFFPGPIELPAIIIWPVAAMIGMGFAASDAHALHYDGSALTTLIGVLAAVCYIYGVKVGLAHIAEPLDFARYRAPMLQPRIDKTFSKASAVADTTCRDSVAPPQLADIGIVMDSTTAVTPLGVFSNVRTNTDGKWFGRKLLIWKAEGELRGYVELYAGGSNAARGMIEVAAYNPTTYALQFRVFYGDGYFDTFDGKLYPGSLSGEFVTSQEQCSNTVTARDQLTLKRDAKATSELFATSSPETLRGLAQHLSSVYRRVPAPTYPDPPPIHGSILVAERFWHEDGTSAAAFTARFKGMEQLTRWLAVEKTMIYARTVDEKNAIASWIAIGPSPELKAYTTKMLRAFSAKDGIDHLSYSLLPVQRSE